jgi:hypothetical protein
LALAVPLSRFTSRVGGGSAFYVRRKRASQFYMSIGPGGHDWTVMIHGHLYGLAATGPGPNGYVTIVHYGDYGRGFVEIPMHIYGVASIAVLIPIIFVIIVYAIFRWFKKRSA